MNRCLIHATSANLCDGPHEAHVCAGDRLAITAPGVRDCSCGWHR